MAIPARSISILSQRLEGSDKAKLVSKNSNALGVCCLERGHTLGFVVLRGRGKALTICRHRAQLAKVRLATAILAGGLCEPAVESGTALFSVEVEIGVKDGDGWLALGVRSGGSRSSKAKRECNASS